MKRVRPLPVRQLRAQMELKNLTLRNVSELSGVNYTQCSGVLNGYIALPELVKRVRQAIESAPEPIEATA